MHLVTGGSGFIGSTIANRLVKRGEKVRVLDKWRSPELSSEVDFFLGDVTKIIDVEKALKSVKFVHHNAALVPLEKAGRKFRDVNVFGTEVVLKKSKEAKVEFFCHMSSSAVFGIQETFPITNESSRNPVEDYGQSKKDGEDVVISEMFKGELPISIIRPRTVIGTGRLGIFQILFEWIHDGANIYTIGSGKNLFQFIHVDDLCDTSILSCLKKKEGIFNVGTDRYASLKEDLSYLCEIAGTGSSVKSLPETPAVLLLKTLDKLKLSPLHAWHYLTYSKPFYFDSTPVYKTLNWKPRYSNKEMLENSYKWFVENYDPKSIVGGASSHKRPVKQSLLAFLKKIS